MCVVVMFWNLHSFWNCVVVMKSYDLLPARCSNMRSAFEYRYSSLCCLVGCGRINRRQPCSFGIADL